MRGDFNRLQQVVWNQLTNAVKFTHAGGHVTVGFEARSQRHVEISISATGQGISVEFLPTSSTAFDKRTPPSNDATAALVLGWRS